MLTLTGMKIFVLVCTIVFCSQGMGIECAKYVKNKYIFIYTHARVRAKQDKHDGTHININA